jgi:guanylate kinase
MKLELRLRKRQTETDEQINKRLERAEMEIKQKEKFDHVIINDELEDTLVKVKEVVSQYLPVTEIAE